MLVYKIKQKNSAVALQEVSNIAKDNSSMFLDFKNTDGEIEFSISSLYFNKEKEKFETDIENCYDFFMDATLKDYEPTKIDKKLLDKLIVSLPKIKDLRDHWDEVVLNCTKEGELGLEYYEDMFQTYNKAFNLIYKLSKKYA